MDIFGILTLIGGLALFLYGMNLMGDSLSKLSGGKLESILQRLTSTKLKAVLLGAMVTAVIQSSSATTVMVVGFVNSGIMQLSQSVGIIMGANIGTTITSWILSLTGISGESFIIRFLKPSSFTPILAAIGIILTMSSGNNGKKKDIAAILLGFAILMFGMETMSGAVKPLADNESFTGILTMFSNPILGMAAGAVLTAVIQSSSASVGILQALCATGVVGYATAIPIIMGQNIGTCVTAIISSIGASKNATRASMIHLYFNLIGTIVFMTAFYCINTFIHFKFLEDSATAVGIAVIHSLFNVFSVIVLFPFSNLLMKLATISIRDKSESENLSLHELPAELKALDDRFLETPEYAMELCRTAAFAMAKETEKCTKLALNELSEYNEGDAEHIIIAENLLDRYEDTLGTYLVKLSGRELSHGSSQSMSILLHCVSDLERISDHSKHILRSATEMMNNGHEFTGNAKKELDVMIRAVSDIVEMTTDCFIASDLDSARHIKPLEETIDSLSVGLRQRHINRLRAGKSTIESGIILEDIITDLERISNHCSNIGICMIEVSADGFDTHEYIEVNLRKSKEYADEVDRLKDIYKLPERIEVR